MRGLIRRWSLLGIARALPRVGDARGQTAVSFIALMAMILLMSAVTMNVGEVARLKTHTANAADAGALAAASWVASAENEVAQIARGMMINQMILQLWFIRPFCFATVLYAALNYFLLWLYNYVVLYLLGAKPLMEDAWEIAKVQGLFTALQNLSIDDTSGAVSDELKALGDIAEDDPAGIPETLPFTWDRLGGDGVKRQSSVEVFVHRDGQQPELSMDDWGPWFWFWWPSCVWLCCWGPPPGWEKQKEDKSKKDEVSKIQQLGSAVLKSAQGALWTALVGPNYHLLEFGTCSSPTCFPVFLSIPVSPTTPNGIDNATGSISVEVTQRRAGGARLGFWEMKYDEVKSCARAVYRGPRTGLFSSPNGYAELESVKCDEILADREPS